MENFFDELSKQAAKAVSRREALKVTGRGICGLLLASTPVAKLWARMLPASNEDDAGTATCGAVQKTVQLTFPDPSRYPNHGAFVRAVAHSVAAARDLVTEDCSECIVDQFAKDVPISQQRSCGPVVMPTQLCTQTGVSAQQITSAAVLALRAAPNAWSDIQQFELLNVLVEEILGCLFDATALQPSATQSPASSIQALAVTVPPPAPNCITPDVKYCGPSNSLEHSFLLAVAPCLNEACFFHDNCYSEHCILSPSISHFNDCIFTTQTAAICDVALLQACKTCSFGAVSDPLFKHSSLVCAIATCLAGEPVCDPNLQPNLPSRIACMTKNNNCAAQYTLRSSVSVCNQPAPECRSCNGQSPCGSLEGQDCCASQFCCPCGQTCANGSCQCGPGKITCGSHCCDVGATCCPGPTVDVLPFCCAAGQACCGTTCCAPGVVCCGTTCCAPGQTCQNGTCTGCPPGQTACGQTCCAAGLTCSNGQCVCPSGQPMCGTICCASGQTCQNGTCTTTVCPPGEAACGSGCCNPATVACCPTSSGGFACAPPSWVCCPSPSTYCPPNELCCPDGCCGGFGFFPGVPNPDTHGFTCCHVGLLSIQGPCYPPGWHCCPGTPPNGICPLGQTCCPGGCCPPPTTTCGPPGGPNCV